jgi:CheY-like chemotaxis protein
VDRSLTILIAEDDENYAALIEKVLRDSGRANPVHLADNGQHVIDYLQGAARFADRAAFPFPAMLFLDWKMPGIRGIDVLRWMAAHPDHRVIPTIVLSSSTLEADVESAYRLGAQAYLTKPAQSADLRAMLNDACKFWSWCLKPRVSNVPL